MKKTILSVMLFFVVTITQAQNSLFKNISTTDTYIEYLTAWNEKGDGVYKIKDKRFPVTFHTAYLPTGEGYKIKVVIEEEGRSKGKVQHYYDATDNYYLASGYPYESVLKHKYEKKGFVSIGDYVVLLSGVSKNNTSYKEIEKIYIKEAVANSLKAKENTKRNKSHKAKKMSFFDRVRANSKAKSSRFRAIEIKGLGKMITEYLVAMKAKQDARTPAQLKADKNIIAARKRGEADIKSYNDSVYKTPAHQKMLKHQAWMEANIKMEIINKSGREVYIYNVFHSKLNSVSSIWSGNSQKVSCRDDLYYSFSKNAKNVSSATKFYTANSSCGKSVVIN